MWPILYNNASTFHDGQLPWLFIGGGSHSTPLSLNSSLSISDFAQAGYSPLSPDCHFKTIRTGRRPAEGGEAPEPEELGTMRGPKESAAPPVAKCHQLKPKDLDDSAFDFEILDQGRAVLPMSGQLALELRKQQEGWHGKWALDVGLTRACSSIDLFVEKLVK
jgi:hypothetical protein